MLATSYMSQMQQPKPRGPAPAAKLPEPGELPAMPFQGGYRQWQMAPEGMSMPSQGHSLLMEAMRRLMGG